MNVKDFKPIILMQEDIEKKEEENFELRQTISTLEEQIYWAKKRNKQLSNIIKMLSSHMLLASGLCEIKLADEEVSKLHPKYHNGKEVYEPKYNEFYCSLKEILEVLNEKEN